MKTIIYLLLLLLSVDVKSQIGFNKIENFGRLSCTPGSLELVNDTIAVYGIIYEENVQTWGILHAMMDTSGNLIQSHIWTDSAGDNTNSIYPNCFINVRQKDIYAGIGGIFERIFGYIAIFNRQGILTRLIEYPDSTIFQDFYREILEVPNGFFVLGDKQGLDYDVDIFLMKTDLDGNKLWEKSYGDPSDYDAYGSIYKVNDNEYVIGASTTTIPPSPQLVDNTANFYVIDSLGNLKKEWQSDWSTIELGVGIGLYKNNQGHWIYPTVAAQWDTDFWLEGKHGVVIRDSNFNLISRTFYGDFSSINWIRKLVPLSNGDYLLLGQRAIWDPTVPDNYVPYGSMVRLRPDGTPIWSLFDTAHTYAYNVLYDAVELPSGSIIACGYSETFNPYRYWGWFIKVSPDGCIDTLNCTAIVKTTAAPSAPTFSLSPNPANDRLQIIADAELQGEVHVALFNSLGQQVLSQNINLQGAAVVNVADLVPGQYLVHLTNGKYIVGKQVVIAH